MKKNIFFFAALKRGIFSGPPNVAPAYETRRGVWAMPDLLLKKLLALKASLRSR